MLVLLLAGWSGAGKDTVANQLVAEFGFQRHAFADPVKAAVAAQKQIPVEWLHDPERKKPYRSDLIAHGEGLRATDPEIWARHIAADILRAAAEGQTKFVISDWRHLSELWGLQKKLPAATLVPILIRRPQQRTSPIPDATEYGLMGFPFTTMIINNGTKELLRDRVRMALEQILQE